MDITCIDSPAAVADLMYALAVGWWWLLLKKQEVIKSIAKPIEGTGVKGFLEARKLSNNVAM